MTVEIADDAIILDAERARYYAGAIRDQITSTAEAEDKLLELIGIALDEDHKSLLGYASWDQYFDAELRDTVATVTEERRREWIGPLSRLGWSQRIVAAITGTSQPTVSRELAKDDGVMQNESPSKGKTKGKDGKSYKRRPAATDDQVTITIMTMFEKRNMVNHLQVIPELREQGLSLTKSRAIEIMKKMADDGIVRYNDSTVKPYVMLPGAEPAKHECEYILSIGCECGSRNMTDTEVAAAFIDYFGDQSRVLAFAISDECERRKEEER